jgi:hypothetical protein
MTSTLARPAFYAVGRGRGGVRDWVTLLHPPYTAWHLSYVAIGAALAPRFVAWRMEGALVAFLLAVGLGAHAFDELSGHPLRTGIRDRVLVVVAVIGVTVPVVTGLVWAGWRLVPFVVVGVVLVAGYNLEPFGGMLHNGVVFALGWGAFPVVVGYYTQDFTFGRAVVPAAAAAFALSWAQRALSLPVRTLRRRTTSVEGRIVLSDGRVIDLDRSGLVAPAERALRALSAAMVLLAASLVVSRL